MTVALLIALVIGCGEEAEPPSGRLEAATAPVARPPPMLVVQAAPGRPGVPAELRARARATTADPRLELIEVRRAPKGWHGHRALVRDLERGDLRSYAVGDLLPRGAVLTGIGEASITLMVADEIVVRVPVTGRGEVAIVEDFRSAARPPRPRIRRRAGLSAAARRAAARAIDDLAGPDPGPAAAALVAAGEAVVPLLVARVGDPTPVEIPTLEIGERSAFAELLGDRVIALLGVITGQYFGDPTRPGARATVVAAWQRWAGWMLPAEPEIRGEPGPEDP